MDNNHSKSRLLLIDGDPKSLRVLDVSLKKAGFDVAAVTSGREALAHLEASRPDLIISDTDLDGMDGFELCSHIKARPEWAKIPFLFVSGRKSIEDKIRGLELGVDDYLAKPIYIKEIGIRVRTALQRAERERLESRRDGRTRFAGDLSDVGVVDLVQTIELNRKSGIIHIINRDARRGSIFFRDGKVIDAEVGRLSGATAMYRLFSWSEGQFAVEFKPIRRHDVIDTPIAPLLMEGMRRLDESAHLLEKIPPLNSVLEVDCRALAEELAELPDEVNSVLRLCDGTRTLQEVVEDSEHADLETLIIIDQLFSGKVVFSREPSAPAVASEPRSKLAGWLSEGAAEDGAAADANVEVVESPPTSALKPDGELIPETTPFPRRRTLGSGTNTGESPAQVAEPSSPVETLSAEESLIAALPARPEMPDRNAEVAFPSGDTLKGIPIGNLFSAADRPSPQESDPPFRTALPAEPGVVAETMEARSTKPLGLAERLLSEDSSVRLSAMHEAIAADDGRVQNAATSGRQTREYGEPEAFSAAALVQEVVSASREIHRDDAVLATPEKPSKEVDWGSWPSPTTPSASAAALGAQPAMADVAVVDRGALAHEKEAQGKAPQESAHAANEDAIVDRKSTSDEPGSLPHDPSSHSADIATSLVPPLPPSVEAPKAGRGIRLHPVWLAIAGALTLGAAAYLVFANKASPPQPGSPEQPTPRSQPALVPASSTESPAPATAGPEKGGQGRSSEALRKKCLETDAGGKGKAKAVVVACRPALDANPADVEVMAALARAEIDRGRLAEAKMIAKRMIAADPQRFDAYVVLGTAEQEAGKTAEARAAYKRYLELAPEGPFARELRAILDNL